MDDLREKVIRGMECCLKTYSTTECEIKECPYHEWRETCTEMLMKNAISLLKAQKNPDRVIVVRCRDCVEWEGPTKAEQSDGETIGHCRCRFGTCYGQKTDMNWFCADGERE